MIRAFLLGVLLFPAVLIAEVFPPPGAENICPDTPIRLMYGTAPTPAKAGKFQVFDASNDTVVATIDLAVDVAPPPPKRPARAGTRAKAATGPAVVMAGPPTTMQSIGGLANYSYYPVIITGNEADVYLPNHALGYNKTYYITMEPGFFVGQPGITHPGDWRFTTRAAPPAAGSTKLIVAADNSGDFATVQGAVDFIPSGNKTPTTISILKGTYTEMIYVGNKNAITFAGEDRKQTIIQYADNAVLNNVPGVYHRGVFIANKCDDLVLTNLTIHNTTPHGGSQAEAIILNGTPTARAIVSNVDLYSFQDTLQINGQGYVNNCHIEGDVDFLWGTGPCFFENCQFISLHSKGYYSQIRNTAKNHGYVFHDCTFDGPEGVKDNYLSRIDPQRFPNSEVVLINCVLGNSVGDAGWLLNNSQEPGNIHFWEANSHDATGAAIDVSSRMVGSRQLDAKADAQTIADYSNPTFVLGNNWKPQLPATQRAN